MALTTGQRQKIHAALMRLFDDLADQNPDGSQSVTVLKADIRAALNAIDDALDANAATINGWFPQPFRGAASPEQKALIVAVVALKRAGLPVWKEE